MKWRYRPELDGLRALAVLIIVFYHARVAGWSASFIALDMFFVLSGFLVTNVVLSEVDKTGTLKLGNYYARRVRRLLPAAVVAIVSTSGIFLLIASQPERLALVRHAQAALIYLANWQFVSEAGDYFSGNLRDSPFMHYWSLSIEEQYYIVFPLIVLLTVKLFGHRAKPLVWVFVSIIGLSLASQLYWAQVDPGRAYFATDARMFQLIAGALLAVFARSWLSSELAPHKQRSRYRRGRAITIVALTLYLLLGTELIGVPNSWRNILATPLVAGIIFGLYTAPKSLLGRVFSLPTVVYIGKISYGTYLWHWPTILILERFWDTRPIIITAATLLVATGLAALSFEVLETPIRRSPRFQPFQWRSVAVGLSASVVCALIVVGPILSSPRSPAITLATTPVTLISELTKIETDDVPVPDDLDFEAINQDRGTAGKRCTPTDIDACVRVDGDGPHLVLVGDSQARTLVPAFMQLAKRKGFKLSTSLVTSCPWQQGLYNINRAGGESRSCETLRQGFYEETLPRMQPDVVIFASLARSDSSWEGAIVDKEGDSDELHEMQLDATVRTTKLVKEIGAQVIIIKSMFGTDGWDREGWDPLDCLARATSEAECLVTPPLENPIVDGFYETAATRQAGVATIDLNPIICPDAPLCRPILNGEVVWRNNNHLTAAFLHSVRRQIWDAIVETGVVTRDGKLTR